MSMSDRDGLIWLDGEMVDWRDANVHVLTHTLHYGMGVFEGVRAYNTPEGTAIFKLAEHTKRLFNSAHILGMNMPFDAEALNEAQRAVVRENNLETAYLRPMVFFGSEGMGLRADNLKTHVMVAAWQWDSYTDKDIKEKGMRVRVSSYTRHHINSAMCRAKANGHYFNSMLAMSEAQRDGYDDALLLDTEGFVAEGCGANLFLVVDGEILTPDLSSGLDGITRKTIMKLAADLGYTVREKRITRDEVYIADEAFFTGSAAEVTPIREVDGRQVGSGARGPVTEQLQTLYFDVVNGRADKYSNWLTYVK